MKSRSFTVVLALVLSVFAAFWCYEHAEIADARAAWSRHVQPDVKPSESLNGAKQMPPFAEWPSTELLKLRAEVTTLRSELDLPSRGQISKEEAANDWALVHSGARPSELPGFVAFIHATNVGFATPETAFQSFNFAMRNPRKDQSDDARTIELFDVPDNYGEPGAYRGIDIGEGIGGEIGYRIVGQEMTATNRVQLTVDFEYSDGSSSRHSKELIEHNGRWRMPATVTR